MRLKELVYAFSVEYIRSSYYKKVLRSFLLCSCAVALLFCGVLIFASNRDYGSELASTQEQVLEQAVNINATNLTDIVTYCTNLLNNSTVQTILYGGELTAVQSYDAVELNTSMRRMSSLIRSVYFINFRTGTVIDQNGRSGIGNHSDTDIFERMEAMTPGRSALLCVPRQIEYLSGGHTYSDVRVVSLIFYPNASGAMVVNLDYDAYRGLFTVDSGKHVKLTMINSLGQIFVSTDTEDFQRDIS